MLDSTGAKILDTERDWRRKGIKEAIWERVEDPTLNRKRGSVLSVSHLGRGPRLRSSKFVT